MNKSSLILKTNDEGLLEYMSEYLHPDGMTEQCANCYDCKRAIKNNDIKQFTLCTNYSQEEAAEQMERCKHCIWFWIDNIIVEGE